MPNLQLDHSELGNMALRNTARRSMSRPSPAGGRMACANPQRHNTGTAADS